MKAFQSNKPLCLFLGCINATLLLLIFMASGTTTPPPSNSSGHSHARVHGGQYIVPLIKMRKMVTTATSLARDLPPQYRFYPTLHHGTDAAAGAQQLRLSKLISTRRSLLHLSEGRPVVHHKLMSTTTMAVPIDAKSHAAASTTSTNIPHDHEADVSATFHVDYSGPKTHPPKNN